jgi:hypothetical protein
MSKEKSVVLVDGRVVVKRMIQEFDLLAIETCRSQIAAMVAELEGARARLALLEQDVKDRLAAGCKVIGRLTAVVTEERGPRRPSWRDLYLDHMLMVHNRSPEALQKEVLAETMGKPREVLTIGIKPGKEI